MRTAALAILAILPFLGGCWYDRPNPWNTEDDVELYREKTEENWLLEMETRFLPPQREPGRPLDADLEAFRDTVLPNATPEVVDRMREQSLAKIAGLETRIRSQMPVDENNKDQITELVRLRRMEKNRLALIDARVDAAAGR